jgi:hypothetical protein
MSQRRMAGRLSSANVAETGAHWFFASDLFLVFALLIVVL